MNISHERTGWIISATLHVILALLFLIMVVELTPFELEFSSIAFAPAGGQEIGGGSGMQQFQGEKPLVELPRRRTLDDTSPLLRLPDSKRQAIEAPSPAEKPDLTSLRDARVNQRYELETPSMVVRDRPGFRPIPIEDDLLTGHYPDVLSETISGDEMFTITWEGPARTKISGQLPAYPKDVQPATVRIAFDVTPDGTVALAVPITKGRPQLEKVSLDALKKWRFNPLDKTQAQVKQRGVVTFIFKLK